ncbi:MULTISPECIES: hypothetical protein [Methylomonas]|uniref:Uncharacterized protein n=1 Tax=Methylomonas koyamae TaxID=702114 RepID=A0A177N0C4_9GAMM|nr:hypothetical protein [Methylomonas koyamae]OAI11418.1 hypothetical protein A1355_15990 [Methylomonas koyamae]
MDFQIGEIHKNTPHLFADLAELVLATGYNGRQNLHKNDLIAVIENGNISPDEIDEEYDADNEAKLTGQTSAERNIRLEKQLEDVLAQLGYRANSLDSFYPFNFENANLILISNSQLTERQRIYRFLLACSRLRSFDNKSGLHQRWAKYFSLLSREAMRGLFPSYADVRIFDANSDDRRNYYSTNLKHAIKKLGEDLAVNIIEDGWSQLSTSGDEGIDLVATIPFDDGASATFAFLGQCGAQETGWPAKTLEAHPINLRHLFHWQFDIPCAMFTPVYYRSSDGRWAYSKSANGVLLIDRERILKLIGLQDKWVEITGSEWFQNFEQEFATVNTCS